MALEYRAADFFRKTHHLTEPRNHEMFHLFFYKTGKLPPPLITVRWADLFDSIIYQRHSSASLCCWSWICFMQTIFEAEGMNKKKMCLIIWFQTTYKQWEKCALSIFFTSLNSSLQRYLSVFAHTRDVLYCSIYYLWKSHQHKILSSRLKTSILH